MNLLEDYKNEPEVRRQINDLGIHLTFQENGQCVMTFYLTDEVRHSSHYVKFTELCLLLDESDVINVVIDSPGGYLSGADMIISGLESTPAETNAVIISSAASAATIIALACDNLMIRDNAEFMVHMVSYGTGGKYHELQSYAEFTAKQYKKVVRGIYEHFLSDEEIKQVIRGEDLYFNAEEVRERWERVIAFREEEIAKAQQEHLEGHIEYLEAQLESLKSQMEPKVKPKGRTKKTS